MYTRLSFDRKLPALLNLANMVFSQSPIRAVTLETHISERLPARALTPIESPVVPGTRFANRTLRFLLAVWISLIAGMGAALALDMPAISPASKSSATPLTITITATSSPPGASIHYTTDGTNPTNSSPSYSSPFQVASPTTLKAIVYDSATSTSSSVSTKYYDINPRLEPVVVPDLSLRLRAGLGVEIGLGNPPVVQTWADLSGTDGLATAAASSAPRFGTTPLGKNAIQFNGYQLVNLPSGFASNLDSATIFVVTLPKSRANAPVLHASSSTAGDAVVLQVSGPSGQGQITTSAGTTATAASSDPLQINGLQVLETLVTPPTPTATGTVLVNGRPGPTNLAMNPITSISRDTNSLAAVSNSDGNRYFGDIIEILFYKRALSDSERRAIRIYLMQAYGIEDTLPSPTFTPAPATLAAPSQVAIGPAQANIITKFTTDGTTPSHRSRTYTSPLWITHTQTIRAINFISDVPSAEQTATYTLDANSWPAPNTNNTPPLDFILELPTNAVQQ